MKTHFLISTLLVIAIQVMVNGQTPGSTTRKIRMTLGANQKTTAPTEIQKSSKTEVVDQLMHHADYFSTASSKFKTESSDRQSTEKGMMLEESVDLLIQSLLKEIEASEVRARITYVAYTKNTIIINDLLIKETENIDDVDHALNLIEDAKYAFASSKQLRSEAYMEVNPGAKLGRMGNAEEKEQIALNKQEEAIQLLEKGVAVIKIRTTEIAYQNPTASK